MPQESDSFLTRPPKCCVSHLRLVLNITLETIPPSQAQNNPNRLNLPMLTVFSRLTCTVHEYHQNRLMSKLLRPSPETTLVCPSACSVLRFHAKGYDGDEYASRSGTASPARWKRTPRHTRNITPEPPAERDQVSQDGLADRYRRQRRDCASQSVPIQENKGGTAAESPVP